MWDAWVDRLIPAFTVFTALFVPGLFIAVLVQHEPIETIAASSAGLGTVAVLIARRR